MLFRYDGADFTQLDGSPPDAVNLRSIGGRLYFVQTETANGALWVYDAHGLHPAPAIPVQRLLRGVRRHPVLRGGPERRDPANGFVLQRVIVEELPGTDRRTPSHWPRPSSCSWSAGPS